jgi:hypothetical protein
MVCLRVHYCVQLLPDIIFFETFLLFFSFAKVFSFTFLINYIVSFIWNSQKCPISQNKWRLIKTQLRNRTQTVFQGGSPWATLIHNGIVCLRGPLLNCVQLLPEVFCFANILFTVSFAKAFFFYFLEFSGMSKFPKIYCGFFNTQSKKQQPNNFPRG